MNAPETDRTARRTLVLGIGNSLRRDDGIGPAVVRALQQRQLPNAQLLVVHQLTPELAEDMAAADQVVFVDAALGTPSLRMAPVEPAASAAQPLVHFADPASLVAFTQQQFGHAPRAWVVGVPAYDLGYGEGFSTETQAQMNAAIEAVSRILEPVCTSSL